MPAASTKSESKASAEVIDPIKQAVNLLDKKVRNLEKRKSKLDSYKSKADNGATLEKDQEEAIAHYEEVIQNLEFAKDLQKQIIGISVDAEKVMKKQAKRDKAERQLVEIKRFRELLQLQSMLDNLGSDSVRNDFKTGKHGAVVLTEENLTQLDELYKLISPSRDGEQEFGEQLNQAAEHMVSLLDSKDKEVVGTTYKELKELMDLINGCGYFENMPGYEEEAEEEKNPVEVPPAEPDFEEPIHVAEHVEEETQPVISVVPVNEPISQQYSQPIETDVLEAEDDQQDDGLEQDPYYAATSAAYRQQRPFQEIVSSVQGSFNFLQESTIDIESPHMDPAVVAMAPAPIPHPVASGQTDGSGGISQQSYAAQAMLGDHHHQQQSQQTVQSSRVQPAPSDSQQSVGSVDYSSQVYNQNAMAAQNLTGSPATYQLDDATSTHPAQSQNIHSQPASASLADPTVASMMPAHIPIPNQSNLSQDDGDPSNQSEKKPFTMNANAAVFQSMYSSGSGSGSGGQSGGEKSQQQSPQQSATDYNYQGGFQNNNNNSYQRSGSGGNRGGFRGGRGGRGGMTNGYPPRGGSRGGSMNGRGGFGNGRDTSRGSYQGYPPRSDYRPEGYQGYSNNTTSYYNKRGGGPTRGSSRGGPRGGSGGRGGPRTGGFGRPMNMNSQTAMSQ